MNEIMMAMPWPSCTMEVEHDASPWKNRSLLRQSRCTVQLGGGVGANFTVKPSQPMYILYSFTLSLVLKRSVNLFGTSSCKTSFRVFVSSCLLLCFFCFASCLLVSTCEETKPGQRGIRGHQGSPNGERPSCTVHLDCLSSDRFFQGLASCSTSVHDGHGIGHDFMENLHAFAVDSAC